MEASHLSETDGSSVDGSPSKIDPDIKDLIQRARSGDDAAEQSLIYLFDKEIKREIRFLIIEGKILPGGYGAIDLYQSTVLRFIKALHAGKLDHQQFDKPSNLIRFVKRIAKNRFIDLLKQKGEEPIPQDSEGRPIERVAEQSSPSQIVSRREIVCEIQCRLSPRDRRVMELRNNKIGWPDIARELGESSPEALRKSYQRALDLICEDLELHSVLDLARGRR